jgi:hypothetical protein
MTVILATWEARLGGSRFKGNPANSLLDPISKISRAKWPGRVAHTVEHLLCKHESLSSNPGPTKKKIEVMFFVLDFRNISFHDLSGQISAILGFKLRASRLLGRHSTASATPAPSYLFVYHKYYAAYMVS